MQDVWTGIKDIVDVVAKLGVPLLGYGAWILRDIRAELRGLREGLLTLEIRRESDEQDRARMRAEIDDLNKELRRSVNGRREGAMA